MTDSSISNLIKPLLLRDRQSGSVSNLTVTEEQIETVIAPAVQEILSKLGQTSLQMLIRELEGYDQRTSTEGDGILDIINTISQKSPEALHGEQDIKMSPWHLWEARSDFVDMDKRGVYIIANFDGKPGEPPSPMSPNVIYIGETHGGTMNFKKRLRLFHRAAQNGEKKHAGGRSYFRQGFDPNFPKVYFSVLPSYLPDQHYNEARILYIERTLIGDYVSEHGRLPACNSK